jgi:hypothetical protein
MFSADFQLKRISGTDPKSEYFVVTETNGYTVGVKPFLAITPQGRVKLGVRVRANGDPESAQETLGLPLAPKSEKHSSATFDIDLGFVGELALAKAMELIDSQKLVRKLASEILSPLKGNVELTEKEFILSESLISVIDDLKMKIKESEDAKEFKLEAGL